jgi:hypothetical protein
LFGLKLKEELIIVVDGGCGGGGWLGHAGAVLAEEVSGVGQDVEADVGVAVDGVGLALGDVHGQVAAVVAGRDFELKLIDKRGCQ